MEDIKTVFPLLSGVYISWYVLFDVNVYSAVSQIVQDPNYKFITLDFACNGFSSGEESLQLTNALKTQFNHLSKLKLRLSIPELYYPLINMFKHDGCKIEYLDLYS